MNIRFWAGIVLLLVVTGCGSGGTPTRTNDFTPLTSIEISAATSSIAFGTSTPLTATGNFSGLFSDDISSQVTWSSDNTTVANFDTPNTPRIRSSAPGTATLTATKGTVSATFRLTVTPATLTELTITPQNSSISKGLNRQFTASGSFSDDTTQDLTADVLWQSDNAAVATVGSEGLAQPLSEGTANISASFKDLTRSTSLTVTAPVLRSITIEPSNPSVLSISRKSFLARGQFSDNSSADITGQVAWSSSQTNIATIAADGSATTLLPGTTAISASLDGVSASTNLRVTGGNLTAIAVTPATPGLVPGTVARMTATGTFGSGLTRDITGMVTWASANTDVAAITSTTGINLALLNALQATTAQVDITAKSGSVTGTAKLTVTAPALQSITIAPDTLNLSLVSGAGTVNTGRFTVTGTYSDGSARDLTRIATWISGNSTVAAIADTGSDKGRASGITASATPVTITASVGDKTDTATVTVTQRTLLGLTITRPSAAQTAGSQAQFTVTANYSGGIDRDVTEDAVLSIDKPNVAVLPDSVNSPGQVWFVDAGSATFTAAFGGKSKTEIISVP